VYSAVERVVVRPLPYPDADRMAVLWRTTDSTTIYTPEVRHVRAWRELDVFEEVGFYRAREATLTGRGDPEALRVKASSDGYFDLLGASPLLGRTFSAEQHGEGARVVILSHDFWTRRFGRSEAVLGETLLLDDEPFTVVGVLPPRVYPPNSGPGLTDLWVPLGDAAEDLGVWPVTRLRSGATLERANERLTALAEGAPAAGLGPPAEWRCKTFDAEDFGRTRVAETLGTLFTAAVLLLLVAAVNVSTLLLQRASARDEETAVRVALGAALVAGALPMLRLLVRDGWSELLRTRRTGPGAGRWWTAWALVAGEVGLSFALLTGTVLVVDALAELGSRDPGFGTAGLVTVEVTLPDWRYETEAERRGASDDSTPRDGTRRRRRASSGSRRRPRASSRSSASPSSPAATCAKGRGKTGPTPCWSGDPSPVGSSPSSPQPRSSVGDSPSTRRASPGPWWGSPPTCGSTDSPTTRRSPSSTSPAPPGGDASSSPSSDSARCPASSSASTPDGRAPTCWPPWLWSSSPSRPPGSRPAAPPASTLRSRCGPGSRASLQKPGAQPSSREAVLIARHAYGSSVPAELAAESVAARIAIGAAWRNGRPR